MTRGCNYCLIRFTKYTTNLLGTRYPGEDAAQIPKDFVVRKPGSNITAAQVMDYVAKQACSKMQAVS